MNLNDIAEKLQRIGLLRKNQPLMLTSFILNFILGLGLIYMLVYLIRSQQHPTLHLGKFSAVKNYQKHTLNTTRIVINDTMVNEKVPGTTSKDSKVVKIVELKPKRTTVVTTAAKNTEVIAKKPVESKNKGTGVASKQQSTVAKTHPKKSVKLTTKKVTKSTTHPVERRSRERSNRRYENDDDAEEKYRHYHPRNPHYYHNYPPPHHYNHDYHRYTHGYHDEDDD